MTVYELDHFSNFLLTKPAKYCRLLCVWYRLIHCTMCIVWFYLVSVEVVYELFPITTSRKLSHQGVHLQQKNKQKAVSYAVRLLLEMYLFLHVYRRVRF